MRLDEKVEHRLKWIIVIIGSLFFTGVIVGFITGLREAHGALGNTKKENVTQYSEGKETLTFDSAEIKQLTGIGLFDEMFLVVDYNSDSILGYAFKYNNNGKTALVRYEKLDRIIGNNIRFSDAELNDILQENFPNHKKNDFKCEGKFNGMLMFQCVKHAHGFTVSTNQQLITIYSDTLKNEPVKQEGGGNEIDISFDNYFLERHEKKEVC